MARAKVKYFLDWGGVNEKVVSTLILLSVRKLLKGVITKVRAWKFKHLLIYLMLLRRTAK